MKKVTKTRIRLHTETAYINVGRFEDIWVKISAKEAQRLFEEKKDKFVFSFVQDIIEPWDRSNLYIVPRN